MGISMLEKVLTKNSDKIKCYKEIQIRDLIDPNRSNVIIVDVKACFYRIVGKTNFLYGGQTKILVKELETFIKSFNDIGIQLVVIKQSMIQPRNEHCYIDDPERAEEFARFFSDMSSKHAFYIRPDNYEDIALDVFAKHNVQVFQNMDESEYEVAKYASNNNCIAILAQDSDFMFFNISQPYISLKHLNVNDMTTIMYDKEVFARMLGLNIEDLVWISIIMENVDYELKYSMDRWKFHKVAKFLRLAKKRGHLTPQKVTAYFKTEASPSKENIAVIKEKLSYRNLKKIEDKCK